VAVNHVWKTRYLPAAPARRAHGIRTGKTLVAMWAAERSAATTVLVLAPALALVRQIIDEWSANSAWDNWAVLPVRSATDVATAGTHRTDHTLSVTA